MIGTWIVCSMTPGQIWVSYSKLVGPLYIWEWVYNDERDKVQPMCNMRLYMHVEEL